jgi:hypothetical protein
MKIIPTISTPEEALKRAVFWIAMLAEVSDVDPNDTSLKISAVKDGEEKRQLAVINLMDDLRAFDAFGGDWTGAEKAAQSLIGEADEVEVG